MPVTYTNRKGITYFLCQGVTKTGKPRYYFAGTPRETPVEAIPEGFRITESANGRVTLERDRPSRFLPEEVAAVEAAIARHPHSQDYHLAVKDAQIVISERPHLDGSDELAARLGLPPGQIGTIRDLINRQRNFTPVLRFLLSDVERRICTTQRWCSLGSIDDWIDVGMQGPLAQIAGPTMARLGDDAFYDLFWGGEGDDAD